MYNTAKELHIALDIGFQNLNSNRKLQLKPHEKDWVLNETMLELISNKINPNKRISNVGFEDTFKRIDELESLKVNYDGANYLKAIRNNLTGDKFISSILPHDYFRMISCRSLLNYYNGVSTKKVIKYTTNDRYKIFIIHFPHLTDSFYDKLKIYFSDGAGSEKVVFDSTASGVADLFDERQTFDATYDHKYYDYGTLKSDEARFVIIKSILDSFNSIVINGVNVTPAKWEHYARYSRKDHFVVIVDETKYEELYSELPVELIIDSDTDEAGDYKVTCTRETGLFEFFNEDDINDNYSLTEKALYNATTFNSVKNRIVKSSEVDDLLDHSFGKTKYNSPLSVIRNGEIVTYFDDTFEIKGTLIEYYRKPKLIDHMINFGCEIDSDDFKLELVSKAIQKISSRIDDNNYQKIVNENLLLT